MSWSPFPWACLPTFAERKSDAEIIGKKRAKEIRHHEQLHYEAAQKHSHLGLNPIVETIEDTIAGYTYITQNYTGDPSQDTKLAIASYETAVAPSTEGNQPLSPQDISVARRSAVKAVDSFSIKLNLLRKLR